MAPLAPPPLATPMARDTVSLSRWDLPLGLTLIALKLNLVIDQKAESICKCKIKLIFSQYTFFYY